MSRSSQKHLCPLHQRASNLQCEELLGHANL
jgi:hypothetical protein